MGDSRSWKRATKGTYIDGHGPKAVAWAFVIVAFALLMTPAVAMIWAPTTEGVGNESLAEPPSLIRSDGSFNEGYLSGLGECFEERFAYRDLAITANAELRALLDVSATDQVVLGDDGWLYYGGTLPDYLGQSALSDRGLANIAHNLALAQGYAESLGSALLFVIAPNKNSLYDEAMPYYYLRCPDAGNAERLKPYLDAAGVDYVDLFSLFRDRMDEGEPFHYLKTDSHWDNYWALLAGNALLEALDRPAIAADYSDAVKRPGFVGDLQAMLYPADSQAEDNYYFEGYNDLEGDRGSLWEYTQGEAVTDGFVTTEAPGQEGGSLLMFRDSFGNALLPFLASQFEEAAFSKMVPYDLGQMAQRRPDAVVIERAERHLGYLAENPPVMAAPRYEGARLPEGAWPVEAEAAVEQSGSYWVVSGSLGGEALAPQTEVRLVATLPDGAVYTFLPFHVSAGVDGGDADDNGFLAYVPTNLGDLSAADFSLFAI